jgi:hypothetical protein
MCESWIVYLVVGREEKSAVIPYQTLWAIYSGEAKGFAGKIGSQANN